MNINWKWVSDNQFAISYIACFIILSYLFGLLWAVILLFSIELIENNFQLSILRDTEEAKQDQAENKKTYHRKYTSFEHTKNNPPRHFLTTEGESGTEASNTNSVSANMFSQDEKLFRKSQMQTLSNQNELRPSLSSLIYRGRRKRNKENHRQVDSQPLLAVVKNNMHLRRHSQLGNTPPKSPLYRNLIPSSHNKSFGSSPNTSAIFHQNSGWINPLSIQKSSPVLNRSSYENGEISTSVINASKNGLEVHGSYFLNKSLLHSDLTDNDTSFSLVNSKFQSPITPRINSPRGFPKKKTVSIHDDTSTESVVSVLKEKSKRKRKSDEANDETTDDVEPAAKQSKRSSIHNDSFNETLDELFPAPYGSIKKRKSLREIRTSKKRTSSIGTQYEDVNNKDERSNENQMSEKRIRRNSPHRGKIGLTEEQTDQLMGDEKADSSMNSSVVLDGTSNTQSTDSKELEDAVNHVKQSITKYKESTKIKEVTFNLDNSNNESDAFSTPIKVSESYDDSKNKYSILKSLKSPYKKILNTSPFPSNLPPGSAEKRRKHPVFFTAKIDIDEIQSNREEYGERGASLKAFRLDQEEAKKRVDSLLEEAEEPNTSAATQPSISITSAVPSIISTSTPATTANFLPSLQKPATSNLVIPSLTTTLATPTTTQPTEKPGKSVTFNFQSQSSAVPGFSLSTNNVTAISKKPDVTAQVSSSTIADTATTVPTVASVPSFAFPASSSISGSGAVSSAGSFSFSKISTESTAKVSSAVTFSFNKQPSKDSTSAPSFSFANPSSTTVPLPTAGTALPQPSIQQLPTAGTRLPQTSIQQLPTAGSTLSQTSAQPDFSISTLSNKTSVFGGPTKPVSDATQTIPVPFSTSSTSFTSTTGSKGTFSFSSTAGNVLPGVPTTGISFLPPASTVASFSATSFGAVTTATASTLFAVPATTTTTTGAFGTSVVSTVPNMFAPSTTSTAAALFGQTSAATITTNLFNPTKNVFGTAAAAVPTTNIFAENKPATTQSVFSNTGSNVFGNQNVSSAAQQPTNIFAEKQAVPTFSFGAAVTQPATTSTTGFTIGTNPPTVKNVFAPATTPFAPPSSANVFGGAGSTQNTFQPSSTTASSNVFGTSSVTNVFGNTNSSNVFGLQQPSSGGFNFAAPKTTTSAPFGTAASTKSGFSFGATTTSTNTNSIFGQPGTTSSVFGQPSANPFGASSSSVAPFGTNNNQPSAATVFGNNNNNTATVNPFSQTQPAGSGFDFSSSLKQGPSLSFGAGSSNAFGAQASTPAKPSFNFGGTGTPSFGNPSAPSFGTPKPPSFGTPQQNAFGAAPSTPSGGFTLGQGSGNPPRQTQRARRRLRK